MRMCLITLIVLGLAACGADGEPLPPVADAAHSQSGKVRALVGFQNWVLRQVAVSTENGFL